VGGDLLQGIVTLPFFYFLEAQTEPEKVIARLEPGVDKCGEASAKIVAQVRASGAIQSALAEAHSFAEQARAALAPLPAGPYREALADLPAFVVSRQL
jgi:geranylgeranyl pyrophosphate synthase